MNDSGYSPCFPEFNGGKLKISSYKRIQKRGIQTKSIRNSEFLMAFIIYILVNPGF